MLRYKDKLRCFRSLSFFYVKRKEIYISFCRWSGEAGGSGSNSGGSSSYGGGGGDVCV